MLSETINKRIERLAKISYHPSDDVKGKLASKKLIMLVSATGMGKSTIMRGLAPDIPTVGTITTRPQRSDDASERYHFYEHSDEGLAPLLDDIETGTLVQYVINPHSGYIYGSSLEDYPNDINVGDYFSTVVDDFMTYGFKEIIPISVITEPDMWQRRFDKRFPIGHPDRLARCEEAITSLKWSLSRPDVKWVINRDNKSQAAVTSVKDIVEGKIDEKIQTEAVQLAKKCLQTIQQVANVKAIQTTLVFLKKDDTILLGRAKRGFGKGKWNAPGGKLEPNETHEIAMIRECEEEIAVTPISYSHMATLEFHESFTGSLGHVISYVYLCKQWRGEPTESEEMSPQWFELSDIPYDKMWPDDKLWLPLVLEGKKLQARFILDKNAILSDYKIIEKEPDET